MNNNYNNCYNINNLMILDDNLELIWNFNESNPNAHSNLRGSLNNFGNAYRNASDIFNKFDSNSWLIIIPYNNHDCIFDLHSFKINYVIHDSTTTSLL